MSILGLSLLCVAAVAFGAAGMTWLWSIHRVNRGLLLLGVGSLIAGAGFALQTVPGFVSPVVAATAGSVVFVGGALVGMQGFCVRVGRSLGKVLPAAILGGIVGGQALLAAMGFDWRWLLRVGDTAFAAVMLIAVVQARLLARRRTDAFMAVSLIGFAAVFGTRTWIAYPQVWFYTAFLTNFALSAGMVLVQEMSGLVAELREARDTDALTGLLNRGGFHASVEKVLASAPRPVILAVCDVDHFKQVNDRYGHGVGDCVLAAFGRILAAHAGTNNIVGRIGGEEFAILFTGADIGRAVQLTDSVRVALADSVFDAMDPGSYVTASFGVAEATKEMSFDDVLRQADRLLYEAKSMGRNRTRA